MNSVAAAPRRRRDSITSSSYYTDDVKRRLFRSAAGQPRVEGRPHIGGELGFGVAQAFATVAVIENDVVGVLGLWRVGRRRRPRLVEEPADRGGNVLGHVRRVDLGAERLPVRPTTALDDDALRSRTHRASLAPLDKEKGVHDDVTLKGESPTEARLP